MTSEAFCDYSPTAPKKLTRRSSDSDAAFQRVTEAQLRAATARCELDATVTIRDIYAINNYAPVESRDEKHRFYETLYQRLGRTRGEYGTRAERKATVERWSHTGLAGAQWLVQRMAHETNVDALSGICRALVALGAASVRPAIQALEMNALEPDARHSVFRALGEIGTAGPLAERIVELATPCTHAADPDIRDAAYAALSGAQSTSAKQVLRQALLLETDSDLKDTLNSAITEG